MKKVFVVTSGTYSDYHINAVFTDEDEAEKYRMNFKYGNVEEFELDPSTQPIDIIQVWMTKDGTTKNVRHMVKPTDESGFYGFYPWESGEFMIYKVNTDNEEKAVKVVNEKRCLILSFNLWGEETVVRKILRDTI